MKLIKTLALILMSGMLFISCEKEYSEENGGGGIAAGTLKAAGTGECLPSSVQGNYIAGTVLTASNFINVTVDITTLGAYTISSDLVNGYTFSASGITTSTGVQTIKLLGAGTPTADGLNTFTVKFGTSQCNIAVDVYPVGTGNAVIAGVDCSGFVLSGTYTQNTAMTNANTVEVELDVTTAGLYNISTNAVNGVTFSASGFLAAGTQMVALTASGTPTTSGLKTYTVTSGANTCTFDVTYAVGTTTPPTGGNTWSFKAGATTYSGTTNTSFLETTPVPILEIIGVNPAGGDFSLMLTATSGNLGSGTYPGTVTGLGKFSLSFDYSEGSTEFTFMTMLGGNISTVITTYNTATKVVEGTFSGTVKAGSDPTAGAVVNITEGKFKASLP